jgi:DNA replication protein DnaC
VVFALERLGFVDERKNLIVYVNVDTRKPPLATTVGIEAQHGQNCAVLQCCCLVNQLGEAEKQGEANRFFKRLAERDLLICDEWGCVPLTELDQSQGFRLSLIATSRGSVIITTNLEFSRYANVFYDEQMTLAWLTSVPSQLPSGVRWLELLDQAFADEDSLADSLGAGCKRILQEWGRGVYKRHYAV